MVPFDKDFFCCPICRSHLKREEKTLLCERGHSFDIAAKGYVNLLRAFGASHGDNADMVMARRRFLSSGAYAPMRDAVCELLKTYLPSGGVLLDSGCGEGYYTEAFSENPALSVYGIDISPKAAALCAKKNKSVGVAVASCYDLPIVDGACDAITNIFSPFCREEFRRVLKTGGIVIDVIPAERHLYELKAAIYDTPYENRPKPVGIEGFDFIEKKEVTTRFTLDGQEAIRDLVLMTPYFYRTGKEGHERLSALESIEVSASFYLLVYRKTP